MDFYCPNDKETHDETTDKLERVTATGGYSIRSQQAGNEKESGNRCNFWRGGTEEKVTEYVAAIETQQDEYDSAVVELTTAAANAQTEEKRKELTDAIEKKQEEHRTEVKTIRA